jgi:PAS domain S-box-containing protein
VVAQVTRLVPRHEAGSPPRSTRASARQPSPGDAIARATLTSALFDATLDAIVIMDGRGAITAWNRQAEVVFGWPAADVVGRRLAQVIIPERLRGAHEEGLRRYARTGQGPLIDRRSEVPAVHRDGHEFDAEVTITAVDLGGTPGFAGFIRDLSRERDADAARRRAERRFETLVEQMPGIAYIDAVGGETPYVSPRLKELLGYEVDEWTFDRSRDAVHPDDRNEAIRARAAGSASSDPFTLTYRLRTADGRWRWIRDEAIVVLGEDGTNAVHGVMYDVTGEREIEQRIEADRTERSRIAASLQRLRPGATAEETAAGIVAELSQIRRVDIVVLYSFEESGAVVPLALSGPSGMPVAVGIPLPPARARYLRDSATGPWIDEWVAKPSDDDYQRQWLELGLRTGAYVPFGPITEPWGLISAGSLQEGGTTGILASVGEYAAVTSALLGPQLRHGRERTELYELVRDTIDRRAFTPVYQPVVELESRMVVGYEALTRFHDGTGPYQRFAEGESAGLGIELEIATLRACIEGAASLPAGRWVSFNMSPVTILAVADGALPASLEGRNLVVEITERSAVEDYAAIRSALERMGDETSLAVDDAGAGFSSLRHIIELSPRFVKLDMRLVRGVDTDAARQALIAGMVHFANETGCVLVAEGIETEAERRALRRLGVSFGQGYLLGRPAPAEVLAGGRRS